MPSRRTSEIPSCCDYLKPASFGALLCVFVVCLLSACTSNNFAPVSHLERPKTVTKGSYTVRKGDTLFSIAWRYGRDYRELAKINGIRRPYTIYVGQRISLSRTGSVKHKAAAIAPPSVAQKKTVVKPNAQPVMAAGPLHWQWPIKGALIGRFNGQSNKGIDIKGKAGQPVFAAADGVVVYAGSGLIGYGNLVIVKHSEAFLSAYAHNKKIMVSEKHSVKAGQKIAEIGSSGTSENKLHFEIRKNGKPVNPLWYLPK